MNRTLILSLVLALCVAGCDGPYERGVSDGRQAQRGLDSVMAASLVTPCCTVYTERVDTVWANLLDTILLKNGMIWMDTNDYPYKAFEYMLNHARKEAAR